MITNDEIIEDIQDVASTLKTSSITVKEYGKFGKYSTGLLFKRFGKATDAFIQAGLEPVHKRPGNKISNKQVIVDDICRVAKRLDKNSLSQEEYFKYGKYSDGPLKRIFGSVSEAFCFAGLDHYKPIGKEDIIKDMKACSADECLSSSRYQSVGKYSLSTISYTFGSFEKARGASGLKKSPRRDKITSEQLVLELKKHREEFGYSPTKRSINTAIDFSADKTFYARFPGESWGQILSRAELKSNNQYRGKNDLWYDSQEEMIIANALFKNYIKFDSHKKVCESRKWTCDFYLPEKDLWVEYDGLGEFRKNKEGLAEKIQYYKDNSFNFLILSPEDDVISSLDLMLLYEKRDIEVKSVQFHEIEEFLNRVHYLGSRSDKYYIAAYINSQMVGVITYGNNTNPNEKDLCLNRFATLDILDKNFGSYFMSKSMKRLKSLGHKGKIVSWSDPRRHGGGLYRACNFKLIPGKSKKDYIYVDKKTGQEYHKSKCRVRSGESEPEKADQLGLLKVIIPPKQRWEFTVL